MMDRDSGVTFMAAAEVFALLADARAALADSIVYDGHESHTVTYFQARVIALGQVCDLLGIPTVPVGGGR